MNYPLMVKCPKCNRECKVGVIQPNLKCPDCKTEVIKFNIQIEKFGTAVAY